MLSRSVVSDSLRPHELQPTRLLCPWDSPVKNTGEGGCFLFQGIFLTQGSNPGLLHCRRVLYHLSHQGSPFSIMEGLFLATLGLFWIEQAFSSFGPPMYLPRGMWDLSTPSRERAHVACIGRGILHLWTTREVPAL